MIMIHPDLQNAWTVSNGINVMQPVFGGLYSVPLVAIRPRHPGHHRRVAHVPDRKAAAQGGARHV